MFDIFYLAGTVLVAPNVLDVGGGGGLSLLRLARVRKRKRKRVLTTH